MGHSYDKGWDTKPKLDEARVIAPEVPGHKAKKDRRRWCKGKVGVEHRPEVQEAQSGWAARRFCGYSRYFRQPYWICRHQQVCQVCGKILKETMGLHCPKWKLRPILPQVSIDLNTRVKHNWTIVDYWNDIDRPVRLGEAVEVFEPESGARGPGRIEEITKVRGRKDLVYVSVEWKRIKFPS